MNEFSFNEGKISSGIWAASGAAFKYVVSPLVIVFIIGWVANRVEFDLSALKFNDIILTVLVLGTLIIIFSFFRGFYQRGSRSRALFGVVSVAFVILWIWFITHGGKLSLDVGPGGGTIDFSGLLYLFILVAALRAVFFVLEMFSYRKEYLARNR